MGAALLGLRESWSVAAAKPAVGDQLRASAIEGMRGRVWATITSSDERGVLIAVSASESIAATVSSVARSSSALGAELYSFEDSGQSVRALHLWCRRREILDAFASFCDALIHRCLEGERVHSAFAMCFEEFKRLVAAASEEALPSSIVGLVGELLVLLDLAMLSADALEFWSFPSMERHDFRNGLAALEVKTTLRSQQGRAIVNVHSIDQLEPPEGGRLFLHWIRLERDPAGAASLSRLLGDLSRRLAAPAYSALHARLHAEEGLDAVKDVTFSVKERVSYRVSKSFPRLTPDRLIAGVLDPGVGRVTYDLDLASAAAFRCDAADAYDALISGE